MFCFRDSVFSSSSVKKISIVEMKEWKTYLFSS